MHQECHYLRTVSATDLNNPDYAAHAQSFGARGFTVEDTGDFEATLALALADQSCVSSASRKLTWWRLTQRRAGLPEVPG